jgi:hypothetical protein
MIKKIFLIIFFFLFVSNCGYTPLYNNINNNNFKIKVETLEGDNYINRAINLNLRKYKDSTSEKNFSLKIISQYKKRDLSKDSSGNVSNYQINLSSQFNISKDGESSIFIFEENYNLNKLEDTFENLNNEKNIKNTFATTAVNQLILELAKMK